MHRITNINTSHISEHSRSGRVMCYHVILTNKPLSQWDRINVQLISYYSV